jgi:hypothetical protein
MAYSIRARLVAIEEARRKQAERQAAREAAEAAEAVLHAEFYDRHRAAEYLGISVHQFKRLMAAGKGPACVKAGDTKQATVRWPIGELRAYKADPAGYIDAIKPAGSS